MGVLVTSGAQTLQCISSNKNNSPPDPPLPTPHSAHSAQPTSPTPQTQRRPVPPTRHTRRRPVWVVGQAVDEHSILSLRGPKFSHQGGWGVGVWGLGVGVGGGWGWWLGESASGVGGKGLNKFPTQVRMLAVLPLQHTTNVHESTQKTIERASSGRARLFPVHSLNCGDWHNGWHPISFVQAIPLALQPLGWRDGATQRNLVDATTHGSGKR